MRRVVSSLMLPSRALGPGWLLVLCLPLAACNADPSPDAGAPPSDAGMDATAPDSGSPDASAAMDAGDRPTDAQADAQTDAQIDAGRADAGRADAGPPCIYPESETWSGPRAVPALAAPGLLERVTDPVFGTSVRRITDGPYQHYSKTQPWNSDGSMVFMANGGHVLIDTATYSILDRPSAPTGERRWSTVDPRRLYHLEGTELRAYDPDTDSSALLHDFSAEGCDLVRLGPWEGNLSIGDHRVALACRQAADLSVIVYDLDAEAVIGRRLFAGLWGDANVDWVSISQSGEHVVINWRGALGVRSYAATGALPLVQRLTPGGEHGDICVDGDGNDVYVQVICGGHPDRPVAGVMSYRLDTGATTVIISSDDFICSGHISCRNFRRPGWAYVSSNAHQEAFAVRLDGSQTVQRFAHTHQSAGFEIFAVPDPEGCTVMWGSDWNGSPAAYTAEVR